MKASASNSLKWSAIERFSTQGIQLLVMVILARMLEPESFGLIALLTIFIAISATFVDSGFSSALIRKDKVREDDLSTAFYFNIIVSLVIYYILFVSSHSIALFYEEQSLELLAKVLGLNVIINAFTVVQRAIFTRKMDFKPMSISSFIAAVISGVIGVILAYSNYGVWAIAFQSVTFALLNSCMLWYLSSWRPQAVFNLESLKEMIGFGSMILISGLLDTIYKNLYAIIIGKTFPASQLGYYIQANKLSSLPILNITNIIGRVNFPMMSRVQNDELKLTQTFCKTFKLSAFIMFPLVLGIVITADPLIKLLLGNKWEPVAPLLSLLSLSMILIPLGSVCLNLLKVKGRSDLYLKAEVFKKIFVTINVMITMQFSIEVMCLGLIFSSILGFYVNIHYAIKYIDVTIKELHVMLLPIVLNTIMSSFIASLLMSFFTSYFLKLVVGLVSGLIIYSLLSLLLSKSELLVVKRLVFNKS